VNTRNLSGVSLGWAKRDEWGHECEAFRDVFIAHSCTRMCPSWVVLSKSGKYCSYFDPNMYIQMLLRLGFMR
jgi:hypothetical protein